MCVDCRHYPQTLTKTAAERRENVLKLSQKFSVACSRDISNPRSLRQATAPAGEARLMPRVVQAKLSATGGEAAAAVVAVVGSLKRPRPDESGGGEGANGGGASSASSAKQSRNIK